MSNDLFTRSIPLPVLNAPPAVTMQRNRYVNADTDSFKLTGPALISFSGGRTSAFMLRRILDAGGGTLFPDVKVAFFNTGKERPETLD